MSEFMRDNEPIPKCPCGSEFGNVFRLRVGACAEYRVDCKGCERFVGFFDKDDLKGEQA